MFHRTHSELGLLAGSPSEASPVQHDDRHTHDAPYPRQPACQRRPRSALPPHPTVTSQAHATPLAGTMHERSGAEVSQRIAEGFQFLALSSDAGLMGQAARAEFKAIDFSGAGAVAGVSEGKIYE